MKMEDLLKIPTSYNTCNYSEGGGHSICDHQKYCIFNPLRENLEKSIMSTYNEYEDLNKRKSSYLLDYQNDVEDFSFLLKQSELVKKKLLKLIKFRSKVMRGEVNGYGVLGSTRV